MLATLVTIVADVPLVIVMVSVLAVGTALTIDSALPAVAPDHVKETKVPEPVIDVFEITKTCVAPDAMLMLLNVAENTRPLAVMGPAPGVPIVGVVTNPDPTADIVTFPVVAIKPVPPVTVPEALTLPEDAAIFPVVAVIPVPPVNVVVEAIEPGATKAAGIERTTAPVVGEDVI